MGAGKRSNSYCTVTLFKPVPTGSPHPNPLPKGARGPFVHVERLIILLKIVKLLRSTANSQVIDFQRWLAHANRQTLPFFTADTHAVIQFQVVANEICCMVSIPEPINVAPFTGFVTLPFSIRYASEVEKTNLPEVIST